MPAKGQDMPTSIFLAKLIGPVFLAVGVAMLLNGAAYRTLANSFLDNPALMFLSGLLTLPPGLAIVLTHNVWAADWRIVITIFGWLAVIGGAVRLLAPRQAVAVGRTMLGNPSAMTISAAVWLAIGALLCFFGYFR